MTAAPMPAVNDQINSYLLTYEMSENAGLFPIDSKKMQFFPGDIGKTEDQNTAKFETISLDFDFEFCGISYSSIAVSSYGWFALVPKGTTFAVSDVINSTNAYENWNIDVDSGALFCVWAHPANGNLYDINSPSLSISQETKDEIRLGKLSLPAESNGNYVNNKYPLNVVDPLHEGVKYFRGNGGNQGKYFLIRWRSRSQYYQVLPYDAVIYENGNIEYRYAYSEYFNNNIVFLGTGGTIGVFLTNDTNYRDFSYALKNDSANDRNFYKFGGAIYNGTYADTDGTNTSKYTISLNPRDHWPAKRGNGAIFRFTPPKNKRKQNRRWIGKNESPLIRPAGKFDDRKTVFSTVQNVYYPSGMPTNYPFVNNFDNIHLFTDLLSSGSIELVRSASVYALDGLFEETHPLLDEDGFVEVNLHDQGQSQNSFFLTGSEASIGNEPKNFSRQLSSKDQFRMSFQVDNSVSMLPNSSSIYYFNVAKKQWNIPSASVKDHVGPFDRFSFNTDWTPQSGNVGIKYTVGTFISEDAKAFNCYGFPVASGSRNIFTQSSDPIQNNQNYFSSPTLDLTDSVRQRLISAISDDYPNSIARNQIYAPNLDESFVIPIENPFLLEKSTIEIPFSMGSSWFSDYTTTCISEITKSTFDNKEINFYVKAIADRGGPALTVALFCQKKYRNDSNLELISWNPITHYDEFHQATPVTTRQIFTGSSLSTGFVVIECRDFSRNNLENATVISGSSGFFTGSVLVEMQSKVSNGNDGFLYTLTLGSSLSALSPTDALSLMVSSTIDLENYSDQYNGSKNILLVDTKPFGRSMRGFESIGSAFGREFSTGFDSNVVNRDGSLKNPFYVSNLYQKVQSRKLLANTINFVSSSYSNNFPNIVKLARINLSTEREAPYLLQPGDKLVLAICKTRPATKTITYNIVSSSVAPGSPNNADLGVGNLTNYEPIYGSKSGHDVQLITGSINMTFYGSYPNEGKA